MRPPGWSRTSRSRWATADGCDVARGYTCGTPPRQPLLLLIPSSENGAWQNLMIRARGERVCDGIVEATPDFAHRLGHAELPTGPGEVFGGAGGTVGQDEKITPFTCPPRTAAGILMVAIANGRVGMVTCGTAQEPKAAQAEINRQ